MQRRMARWSGNLLGSGGQRYRVSGGHENGLVNRGIQFRIVIRDRYQDCPLGTGHIKNRDDLFEASRKESREESRDASRDAS